MCVPQNSRTEHGPTHFSAAFNHRGWRSAHSLCFTDRLIVPDNNGIRENGVRHFFSYPPGYVSPDLQNKLVFRTTKTCQNLLKDSPVCLPNQGLMKGYLYSRPSVSLDPGFKSLCPRGSRAASPQKCSWGRTRDGRSSDSNGENRDDSVCIMLPSLRLSPLTVYHT